jgi:hypothetical protein
MLWNPTDNLISNAGTPLMGGMHPIYIFSCNQATINGFSPGFNMPPYIPSEAENDKTNKLLAKLKEVEGGSSSARRQFYGSLTWIAYPLANNGYKIDPIKGLPTDVIIKLRINKEYKNYVCTGENGGKPMYEWENNLTLSLNIDKNKVKSTESLIVYPNPTSSMITIQGKKWLSNSFKILDQMGREVVSGKLNGIKTDVSLEKLSKGYYIIKVDGEFEILRVAKE